MGKDKGAPVTQQCKMDKCTVSGSRTRSPEKGAPSSDDGHDRVAKILSAIQASRSALESQIGVQAEVSLVRQDLRNVVDRVTETEGRISEL